MPETKWKIDGARKVSAASRLRGGTAARNAASAGPATSRTGSHVATHHAPMMALISAGENAVLCCPISRASMLVSSSRT